MIRLPIESPQIYGPNNIRPHRGVLLFGPPGTGKTLLARAVRRECNRTRKKIAFFSIGGSDLFNGNVSDNLMDLFHAAKSVSPSVIFMDEIDNLFLERGSKSVAVLTLLTLLDGIDTDEEDHIFVMAATNDRDTVEEALLRPGRLDCSIHLPLPTPAERLEYLQLFTEGWDAGAVPLDTVAEKARNFSPSDLAALCRNAAITALKRQNPSMRDHPRDWILPFTANIILAPGDMTLAFATVKASCRR